MAATGRATVRYPQKPLEHAVEMATIVHRQFGGRCLYDDLADALKAKASSSTFRFWVSSTRLFGLIEREKSGITLTVLGQAAVDPARQAGALVEAFENVALFRDLCSRFEGQLLPNATGLDKSIVEMGVPESTAPKARQNFLRSARYAGFFSNGSHRLLPPNRLDSDAAGVSEEAELAGSYRPVLEALWRQLPSEGFETAEERQQWLDAFGVIFELVYPVGSSEGFDD